MSYSKTVFFLALIMFTACVVIVACSSGDDDDDDDDAVDDDATDDDTGDDDTSGDDDVSGDTWTDSSSGLTWSVTPSSDWMTWEEAISYCENLSLGGHDDWRLPTISELRSLIRGCDATVTGGVCAVTDGCTDSGCWNDPCAGCAEGQGPGLDGAYWPNEMSGNIGWHWSSSAVTDDGTLAWAVNFYSGYVGSDYTDVENPAWCAR
ncbi:MAG: DUF1566 domain-containing protein [Candidatus Lernaella stagnicola]|nr:DUF1566 domain-containing protein [Candidatus Lernaella stagnicola]